MLNQFSRTELLIGKEGIEKLQKAKVAVFGLGGVGSYVVEGLVRAGIGNFILVDDDKVCLTNLNRQIIATRKTVGKPKVEIARDRILMRKELRARGIPKLKVVYSKEEPIKPDETLECSCKTGCICPPGTVRKCTAKNQVPGSISFVPSVAGLIIAGEVIKDIIK